MASNYIFPLSKPAITFRYSKEELFSMAQNEMLREQTYENRLIYYDLISTYADFQIIEQLEKEEKEKAEWLHTLKVYTSSPSNEKCISLER